VDVLLDAAPSDLPAVDLMTTPDARGEDAADASSGCDPDGTDDHCSPDNQSFLSCQGDGRGFNVRACPFGCGTQGGMPHCLNLEPSGVVQASDYAGAAATPTVTSDVVFNTDDGSITGGLTRAAGSGLKSAISYRQATQPNTNVKVGIFGFTGLTVAAGVVMRARGSSAFAIAASNQVEIAGTLNLQDCGGPMRSAAASAGGAAPGMLDGGGTGAGLGGATMMMMGNLSSGGGGAGYGDIGGRGGASTLSGGAGGQLFGDLTTEPLLLIGGSGGGAGGGGSGGGGAGGGAVQIAVDGVFTLSGTIQAGGCGGRQGGGMGSGGGGGAGGSILLEAATVVFAGGSVVVANGGGGGAGGTGDPTTAGANGSVTASPAAGGTGGNSGGSGGAGGARGATAGVAATTSGTKPAGGGGGGVGRIAIKTLDGTYLDQGATLSPDAGDFNMAGKRPTTVTRAQFQ
jgi:hypothetical protein